MTPQERIKADAAKIYPLTNGNDLETGKRIGYIAGATAEHAHVQPVIEAAEKVVKLFAHKGDHQTCAICQLARALEQWKGKEVKDVCTCSLSHLAAHGECYKCPGRHTRSNLTNPQK